MEVTTTPDLQTVNDQGEVLAHIMDVQLDAKYPFQCFNVRKNLKEEQLKINYQQLKEEGFFEAFVEEQSIEPHVEDDALIQKFLRIKQHNRRKLYQLKHFFKA